ncbi:MAG: glycosyltransferase family 2 protein [Bacteroidota bacterium]|jgi:glycosyltransferase involved in cell wall biosynthesis|nr:glycosyltransferase family 2 protein [Bacteroidota bacterium]NLP20108.1 glycosyltransferase family 2 protein [Bacteroidales bacterium]OQC45657.1 MAG: Poly-beta-1,6-N-acetyl-D-glucosamine synthase [Bacteroidetes bacterium ADurb.Bin028]HOD88482.1 glycosyltransferase family 2 protein [Bacteroidales bacterium]
MSNLVSIIIPTYNEEKNIRECLNSVLEFNYPLNSLEIFVVDGMSEDKTREIVLNEFCALHPNIRLLDNPKRTAPFAFNIGIKESNGDYIVIIGAHSSYSKDYIKNLISWHKKLDAANIGGVMQTEVRNKNKTTSAIIKVLSNKFGVGNANFRTGSKKVVAVDTVAYGCYKKECFDKFGLFNEKLTRNQDIEFNKRLIKGGEKIYLVPNATCTYYARETFSGIAKNNFQNGMWNILTVFYTKDFKSLSLRHFVPLFFVLALLLPLILALFYWQFVFVSALALVLYLLLIISVSIKLNDKSTSFLNLVFTFFTLHISYGTGSLIGILKLPLLAIKKE